MMENLSPKTKRSLLVAALLILAVAAVWLVLLESRSYTRALCRRINEYGFSVSPSDLYTKGYGADTRIREVLSGELSEDEIENIAALSVQCGFGADLTTKGSVELVLWQIDDDNIMIAYLLDRSPQLVFIEDKSNGTVMAINDYNK